jgi:ribosomal protein S12 methylthiotransferase
VKTNVTLPDEAQRAGSPANAVAEPSPAVVPEAEAGKPIHVNFSKQGQDGSPFQKARSLEKRLKRKVGTRQQVIIDQVGPTVAKGRSKGDAPEIDGAVYVASRRPLRVGEIATVRIDRSDAYDLHGTVVGF